MKTRLLLGMLLISSITYAQTWQQFHTKQNVSFATTVTDGTSLYLGYTDSANNYPFAENYNGTSWTSYNSGNAISQESISKSMVLSNGDSRQNKLHLGYINNSITKVEWYESNNGGNFVLKNTAPPGAGSATIIYEDFGLNLFIDITGTIPSGYIYNARIGNKVTNFNLLGGRDFSGNTTNAGTFSFPRLSTAYGNTIATEFDYTGFNESFVVEKYSNGTNQFGKITVIPSGGVSNQSYGREISNINNYTRVSGIVGETKFAAYDATNNIARVSITQNGAATNTNGIFQHAVSASDNGFFKFRKYDGDYYLLYSDATNKLQIDKYTTATSSWSTLTDANVVASSTNTYDMFYYDGSIHILYTDSADTLVIKNYVPSCTVNITDAAFKTALISNTSINTNGNTEIECSEAAAFSGFLSIENENISDVTGLEAFTAITNLNLFGNNLTTIDVSQNTALVTLSVSNNDLTAVTVAPGNNIANIRLSGNKFVSFDLSDYPNLLTANLSSNNLTSIDLTPTPNLESLILSFNNITTIDVSNLSNLQNLTLGGTTITALDVSNNTLLETLFVPSGNLTSLNTTGATALTLVNVNDSNLQEIDLSSNINMQVFQGQNAALTSVNLANGNNGSYNSVVVNNNPNLNCIQIDAGFTPTLNWTIDATASYSTNCTPPIVQRTLTINAINGTVTTNPTPTNGTYADGTVVALTATPAAGYQFDNWSGNAAGTTNSVNITMDADKTVTAVFSLIPIVQRTLTINATNGTVTTNPTPTNGTYADGTVVALSAAPAAGYQFDNWSGSATGTTNSVNITMDADKTVTANFSLIPIVQRTLTINATNGTVTTNPTPTNGTYADGTVVALSATPVAGYQFDGWSGAASGTINPINITMDADKTVTAIYSYNSASNINYVDINATGSNDGSSWTNAYTDLWGALDNINNGDEIWIASGTYIPSLYPVKNYGVNNDNVKIYGGFAGTESSLQDRDMSLIHTTNQTILSGDINNNDDTNVSFGNTTRTDNSNAVIRILKTGITLDGLTISDGYADELSGNDRFGAGIFLDPIANVFTIENCIIKDNVAYWAAGMYINPTFNSNIKINACVFENNLGVLTGAFYAFPESGTTMNLRITNCLFNGNRTEDDSVTDLNNVRRGLGAPAGWIRAFNSNSFTNTTLVNNTFVNNVALGTGINTDLPVLGLSKSSSNGANSTNVISNNIFWGNTRNNGQLSLALGSMVDVINFTSSQISNNIDEEGFTNLGIGVGSINNSNTNPNLTADFKLQITSTAAIDTGNNSAIPTGITLDLSGNNRIENTTVDMGAYEYSFIPQRTLTINATNGAVTTNPTPTNGTYADGTVVTLSATPAAGYQFDSWSGSATGTTNSVNITMDADKTVTANFSLIPIVQRTLTINATNGTVTTNPTPTNGTYLDGTVVALTATPAAGYQFDGWSGDATGTTNSVNITMDADKTVTAIFSTNVGFIENWTGAADTDWSNANNWNNQVPTATSDAVIPPVGNGVFRDPEITQGLMHVKNLEIQAGGVLNIYKGLIIEGDLILNGSLIIHSDAISNGSLILKGTQTGSGNVTYNRYVTSDWHLLSSPIIGQNIAAIKNDVDISVSGVKYAIAPYNNTLGLSSGYTYYTTAAGINDINTSGNFLKGKGYSVKKTIAGVFPFSGALNTTDVSMSITDGSATGNKWNLVGNPFTASLYVNNNADATNNFLTVNVAQLTPARVAIYVWNAVNGSYDIINHATAGSKYIAPGQGFFVESKDNGGTLQFTEAMQSHQTGNIFSRMSTAVPTIKLMVSNGTSQRSTDVKYYNTATIGLDPGYDAGIFSGDSQTFNLFTKLVSNDSTIDFGIQSLPTLNYEAMVIPVGLNAAANTTLSFSVDAQNLPAGINVYLEDNVTNTFTLLNTTQANYTTTVTSNISGAGRFYIHTTQSVLSIDDTAILENINMYNSDISNLRITGLQGKATLKLFTVLGKLVMKSSFTSNGIEDISLSSLSKGVYIVALETENRLLHKKIILK